MEPTLRADTRSDKQRWADQNLGTVATSPFTQGDTQSSWLQPDDLAGSGIGKLAKMLVSKGGAGLAAVTAPQVLELLESLVGRRHMYMSKIYAPKNIEAAIEKLKDPATAMTANADWLMIGGPGRTELSPLKLGAETIPMKVRPLDPSPLSPNVFEDPSVLKLFPKMEDPNIRAGYDMSKRVVPGMLPTYSRGILPGNMGWIQQPYADPLPDWIFKNREIYEPLVQRMGNRFNKSGYKWVDPTLHNVGLWKGTAHTWDTGAVRPMTAEQKRVWELLRGRSLPTITPPGVTGITP